MPLHEDLLGAGDQEATAIQLIETGRQMEGDESDQGDQEETEKILSKSDPQEATVPLTGTVQSNWEKKWIPDNNLDINAMQCG